jgi:N-succinyldiaminopimelate aminotransferase
LRSAAGPSQRRHAVVTDVARLGLVDGAAFCWGRPELVGVAAVPVSAFCADPDLGRPLVRFAFCKRDEVLAEPCRGLPGCGQRPKEILRYAVPAAVRGG